MKKVLYVMLLVLCAACLSSCATTSAEPAAEEQSVTPSRMLDPVPLDAPTSNPEAKDAYNKGTLLMEAEKYAAAEPFFRTAIELDPGYVDAYDHLGLTLRRLGRAQEAVDVLLKSIELNPYNYVPYNTLSLAYQDLGEYQKAFDICNAAIDAIPDDPEGYYNGGSILCYFGQWSDAGAYLRKAIMLYMEQDSVYVYDAVYNYAWCLYYLENYEDAIRYAQVAMQYYTNDSNMTQLIRNAQNKLAEQNQ